jgi:hypothetical protein
MEPCGDGMNEAEGPERGSSGAEAIDASGVDPIAVAQELPR